MTLKIKRIGGSFFGRFRAEDAKALKLRENQELMAETVPRKDYMRLFGMGRHLKINPQKFKDKLRKEWGDS